MTPAPANFTAPAAVPASHANHDFFGVMGHELRNPLNVIATAVEVLNRVDASAAVAVRAREVIAQQTRRLAQMTDRLLYVSRFVADDVTLLRQPVELASLVRRTLASCPPPLGDRQLAFDSQPTEAWVHADAQCIREVLDQLLENAIRYTPAGGKVEVELLTGDGNARFSVRNTGPGIDPDQLPHVFELVVGLTLVKRMVEMHGGTIKAECPAGFTIFSVTLPLLGPLLRPGSSSILA